MLLAAIVLVGVLVLALRLCAAAPVKSSLRLETENNLATWARNRPPLTPLTRGKWFVVAGGVVYGPLDSPEAGMNEAQSRGFAPGCLIRPLND